MDPQLKQAILRAQEWAGLDIEEFLVELGRQGYGIVSKGIVRMGMPFEMARELDSRMLAAQVAAMGFASESEYNRRDQCAFELGYLSDSLRLFIRRLDPTFVLSTPEGF